MNAIHGAIVLFVYSVCRKLDLCFRILYCMWHCGELCALHDATRSPAKSHLALAGNGTP